MTYFFTSNSKLEWFKIKLELGVHYKKESTIVDGSKPHEWHCPYVATKSHSEE